VVESDVALLRLGAFFARVVCNPPFYRAGPRAPDPRREAARHGELDPFLEAASRHLSDGRALFVYPATDSHHLFAAARAYGLSLEACRWVFPSPDRDARLVLARFAPSAFASAAVEVLAPLYEWSADGTPDVSLAAFLRGETISGEPADGRV
jgi:tRNA1(Val) A37 N6-methylase TrmN6